MVAYDSEVADDFLLCGSENVVRTGRQAEFQYPHIEVVRVHPSAKGHASIHLTTTTPYRQHSWLICQFFVQIEQPLICSVIEVANVFKLAVTEKNLRCFKLSC